MNNKPLTGKTILLPGAPRSIGRHIARKFGDAGANLVLPWFDWPESVEDMVEEFSSKRYSYLEQQCDLRDEQQVKNLAAAVSTRFGSITYLINNIERGGMPVVHGSYDLPHNTGQWELEIETTLKAKWNLYHHFRKLLEKSTGGAIVNLSSVAGITGRSGPGASFFNDAYSAANRAVQSFTETWARECAPDIRVNEIMLGLVNSRHGEKTRGWETLTGKEQKNILQRPLLKRLGTENEVAELVWFIAVEATYVTGSVIRMDGGFRLGADRVPDYPPGIL